MEGQDGAGVRTDGGVFRVVDAHPSHGAALHQHRRLQNQAAAVEQLAYGGADGDFIVARAAHAVAGNGDKRGGLAAAFGDRAVQVQQRSGSGDEGGLVEAAEGADFHRVASLQPANLHPVDEGWDLGFQRRHIFINGDEALAHVKCAGQPVGGPHNLAAAVQQGVNLAGDIRLVVDGVDADSRNFLFGGLPDLAGQLLAVVLVDDAGAPGDVRQLITAQRMGEIIPVLDRLALQGGSAEKG